MIVVADAIDGLITSFAEPKTPIFAEMTFRQGLTGTAHCSISIVREKCGERGNAIREKCDVETARRTRFYTPAFKNMVRVADRL